MPRSPRKCHDTSFFHIIVQGINKEYIFKKDRYIERYLNLLNKYKKDTRIEILAYCIMNNHAHILVYTDKSEEMSKYMQNVNTQYAKYYNYMERDRVGYVFRDRFASEPIKNERYLINCINYIHLNPVKAGLVMRADDYKYSSYNSYIRGEQSKRLSKLVGIKYDIEMFKNTEETYVFLDVDTNSKVIIESVLKKTLGMSNFEKDEILKDNVVLRILIKQLRNTYQIKYTEMMENLNITRGRMWRLKEGMEDDDF